MKSVLVRRAMALALCAFTAAGLGYRARVSALQTPAAMTSARGRSAMHAPASGPRPTTATTTAKAIANATAKAAPVKPRAQLVSLRKPLSLESTNNPFAASSWLPPPPPVEVPPAPTVRPSPPAAPPVPFAYVGELNAKSAKPQVFLSNADQLLIVSPGDVIDGQYRVESVTDADVVLTYLPLSQRQVVSIPSEGK